MCPNTCKRLQTAWNAREDLSELEKSIGELHDLLASFFLPEGKPLNCPLLGRWRAEIGLSATRVAITFHMSSRTSPYCNLEVKLFVGQWVSEGGRHKDQDEALKGTVGF